MTKTLPPLVTEDFRRFSHLFESEDSRSSLFKTGKSLDAFVKDMISKKPGQLSYILRYHLEQSILSQKPSQLNRLLDFQDPDWDRLHHYIYYPKDDSSFYDLKGDHILVFLVDQYRPENEKIWMEMLDILLSRLSINPTLKQSLSTVFPLPKALELQSNYHHRLFNYFIAHAPYCGFQLFLKKMQTDDFHFEIDHLNAALFFNRAQIATHILNTISQPDHLDESITTMIPPSIYFSRDYINVKPSSVPVTFNDQLLTLRCSFFVKGLSEAAHDLLFQLSDGAYVSYQKQAPSTQSFHCVTYLTCLALSHDYLMTFSMDEHLQLCSKRWLRQHPQYQDLKDLESAASRVQPFFKKIMASKDISQAKNDWDQYLLEQQHHQKLYLQKQQFFQCFQSFMEAVLQKKYSEALSLALALTAEQKIELCVLMIAKTYYSFWQSPVPTPSDVSITPPHPIFHAGLQLALQSAHDLLDEPIYQPKLLGFNLLSLSAFIQQEDLMHQLIQQGASLDPHSLIPGPSLLSVCAQNDRFDLVQSLIKHRINPLEGANSSSLGYSRKSWAVHVLFEKKQFNLLNGLIQLDSSCLDLPNLDGQTLRERILTLEKVIQHNFFKECLSLQESSSVPDLHLKKRYSR